MYRQCAGLGPCVLLAEEPLVPEQIDITLSIHRAGTEVFKGATKLSQMARRLEDLADGCFRENEFPKGAFLMTGTGVVPPDNFSLENGDSVAITITGIGTLVNSIVKDRHLSEFSGQKNDSPGIP